MFDNYEDIKKKMELYSATTNYKFSTANSKTLKSLKNIRQDFNVRLIYDEKYYRCSVNPKPSVLKKFQKENPRYVMHFFFFCSKLVLIKLLY